MPITYKRFSSTDTAQLPALNDMFAAAFNEPETYAKKPKPIYVQTLLEKNHIIVLAAFDGSKIVGGVIAYMLEKFEQERSEVYLYDMAVSEDYRRQGIGRGLIQKLKSVSKEMGAYIIFVQADRVDLPAVKLYQSMGAQEEPLHFDISVD